MRHVTLEVPLRALPVVGGRQRHGATDTRVESLRDAFDDATLAGGVTSLEDDDDSLPRFDHPVLKLDQFGLQPEKLPEIVASIFLRFFVGDRRFSRERMMVLDFHLQLFVVTVSQIAADAPDELFLVE